MEAGDARLDTTASLGPRGERLWYAESSERVCNALGSGPNGLSRDEAARRLEEYGPNSLPRPVRPHPILRFLIQFNSALIYFLLVSAMAALVLGHPVDAAVIFSVVLVNAVVGYVQEGRAEQALGALAELVAPMATAVRDGVKHAVVVDDLVPGDIVILDAGDRVPADLRLIHAKGVGIDEALLTGESVAAQKQEEPLLRDAVLADRTNMAFSGTLVASGHAMGVVVETGSRTQIGRISMMLKSVEEVSTPLLKQINSFSQRVTFIISLGAAALFAFAVLVQDFQWTEALIAVVALAVGVIPEGLPAVITITLAVGVQRMAARNAVIRKLPAVETLGAISVICTDKTGTLTRNEMTVRRIMLDGLEVLVNGVGYTPQGKLTVEGPGDDSAAIAAALPIIRCGLLCNDASLIQTQRGWHAQGDPMEGALVSLAMKAGLDPVHARGEWPRINFIPFDAAHRFMATLHRGPSGEHVVFIKGAPEVIMDMAGSRSPAWEGRIVTAADGGERVLGFGIKRLAGPQMSLDWEDLAEGVELLGLMGFVDPPREKVAEAVAECRSAGIAIKMITGDHVATALAIARRLNLDADPQALTGADIDKLPDAMLSDRLALTCVFARTSPEHKLRIVRMLQKDGAIIAMTGDGVNDAPSLKQADVGISMGRKGTEAAKEASRMVLLDDNFASIVAAVHEGRTVYDNIRKVIAWTLPTNGGEMFAVVLAILFGFALPMTATQILWINLVLATTYGLALAFEPPEPRVMARPPRSPSASLLTPFLLWRVVIVSVLMAGVSLWLFFAALDGGQDIETARTIVVNAVMVMATFYLFNVRFLDMRSLSLRGALGTPWVLGAIAVVVVAQLAFTFLPIMNRLFDSRPLSVTEGVWILVIGVGLMLLLEFEKLIVRVMHPRTCAHRSR
ncbi:MULTISPECIES: HAD-IC family P-type ATPase [Hyphomicrobiales]|uniref:HAD-IC family P-type ATPase n=1 Tax=Agrobacterium pusense TaxID=648995 RepID=A0AA44ENN1_9HYPH|nr:MULTISPECIES: HAD-IC family P-type ATPase [Hyphomicrobiales]KAB2737379.1 HAD-IC family P-type ATPase [Brucella anthropi]NRF11356.1 HAD-IC family P-type ATPase [Agrobacterium pusense]NRF22066.1 HAD-IC family P-type ATPase [Agrobacterium pusense]CDN95855.1 ATPase, E1-E2 type [Agrobacterium tumefaciens]